MWELDRTGIWKGDGYLEEFEINLVFQLLSRLNTPRVMIDVGAHLGMSLWRFASTGYQVYAFEPNPEIKAGLIKNCQKRPNVHIDGRAVTEISGEERDLYTGAGEGTSTLSPFYDVHTPTDRVRTVTLEDFCNEQSISEIGFLKVDAEGFDLPVLKSLPWDRIEPFAVSAEYQNLVSVRLGYSFDDLCMFMTDRGYQVLVSEWYSFGDEELKVPTWRRFDRYPCQLADKWSWGNIICVREEEEFERLFAAAKMAEKFISGLEDPNLKPFLSEMTLARRAATIQEQVELIGVYMGN